jgi:hypothetical protein
MLKDGTYHILARNWGPDGLEHNRLLSRFIIQNGNIQHIDDHTDNMTDTFPEGPMTYRTLEALEKLQTSGYYQLIHEDEIYEGHHAHLLQPFDFGDIQPDEKYVITGIDYPQGQLVEVWHDAVTIGGKTLSDQELRSIMDKVKDGIYTLTPES